MRRQVPVVPQSVFVQSGEDTVAQQDPAPVSSSFSASILVVTLSGDEALLSAFLEGSTDGMTWSLVEARNEAVHADSKMALFAEVVSPGLLRLRFSIGLGTAVLSVATHTRPLDPRYREDGAFRLSSSNLLKPWTTTS